MSELRVGARIASFFLQSRISSIPKPQEEKPEGFISLGTNAAPETKEAKSIKASKVITRRDYSAIATLKIAGRQSADIAKAFGVPESQIRPHLARAMVEYRRGNIKPDATELRRATDNVAEEKNITFNNSLTSATIQSTALADFSHDAIAEAANAAVGDKGTKVNIVV